MSGKRYYWLKLKRDFFKRHDIRIIESMPNGKDYILFYLKLLCESIDHDGTLRFSEQIPYSEEMLATITDTNVDIVRNAVRIFTELDMMEVLDDGTLYMNEVEKLIGSETEWAEKKRIYRDLKKDQIGQIEDIVPLLSDKSKSKSKSKNNSRGFTPPTLEEVSEYCSQRKNKVDPQHFIDYYQSQNWKKSNGQKLSDWKAAVRTWEQRDKEKTKGTKFQNFEQRDNSQIADRLEERLINR